MDLEGIMLSKTSNLLFIYSPIHILLLFLLLKVDVLLKIYLGSVFFYLFYQEPNLPISSPHNYLFFIQEIFSLSCF